MPIEILTSTQRAEWERFPEEIDEAALTAFFSFADDELVQIAARRGVHGRFAIAVAVGALRWLGFVPSAQRKVHWAPERCRASMPVCRRVTRPSSPATSLATAPARAARRIGRLRRTFVSSGLPDSERSPRLRRWRRGTSLRGSTFSSRRGRQHPSLDVYQGGAPRPPTRYREREVEGQRQCPRHRQRCREARGVTT